MMRELQGKKGKAWTRNLFTKYRYSFLSFLISGFVSFPPVCLSVCLHMPARLILITDCRLNHRTHFPFAGLEKPAKLAKLSLLQQQQQKLRTRRRIIAVFD